jgi:hypothetical protein
MAFLLKDLNNNSIWNEYQVIWRIKLMEE